MDRDFFFISKVDSCKLSIPLKRIDEVIPQLIEHFTDYRTNRETGETRELKSFLGDPFIIDNTGVDGTYVKIWIETQITHYLKNLCYVCYRVTLFYVMKSFLHIK